MQDVNSDPRPSARRRPRLRWWLALLIGVAAVAVVAVIQSRSEEPFQSRNLASMGVGLIALALWWLWWLLLSRAPWRWRLAGCGGALLLVGAFAAMFRIRGVSGDLLPILEPRWHHAAASPTPVASEATPEPPVRSPERGATERPDFPQFLGPDRNCVLSGPALEPDWETHPPRELWRQPIGPAWSGFAIVGDRAFTQEQRGPEELVTCYEAETGRKLWEHADPARYFTTLAGEGPRATPTVVGDRVFTLGATGVLNCLERDSGRPIWQRRITEDAGSSVPEWGFAGSPLVLDGKVIVSAGGKDNRSLLAYAVDNGELIWAGGTGPAGYSSPFLAKLDGTPQVLIFNRRQIAAHAPADGRVLWEYPWGTGKPHVAEPVVVGPREVVFSSGYGVGAERLAVHREAEGAWRVESRWRSRALKAKFANFIAKDGLLYGLDDGILVAVDVTTGRRVWKQGRYGHGQMLRVGDLVLLTAERGDLVLLRPSPEGPNELHRFPVFRSKTWNPPALAGDLLLVRNDQEAAALLLPLDRSKAGAHGP